MIKFNLIPNTEHFLCLVSHSQGQVLLHLPDQTQCDLKEDHTAQQLFRIMAPGQDGICISLSDSKDIPAFIGYMIGT